MVLIPKLKDYDINVLITLGNQAEDEEFRNNIKDLILEKVMILDSSMFFLLNKFMKSSKILREVYAKVIVIRMQDEDYYMNDSIINEILALVSLDDLIYYGANSCSLVFSKKCIEAFWNRSFEVENTSELNRKNARYRRRLLVEKLKRKGDNNDKY